MLMVSSHSFFTSKVIVSNHSWGSGQGKKRNVLVLIKAQAELPFVL